MGKFICSLCKNGIFWMIMTGLFCLSINVGINIIIAYLLSFLIEEFLPSLLFLKYFIILILFFYNYFLLRKIVISWLFEWQFPIQKFSIYKERQIYITYLKMRLRVFINLIEKLSNGIDFILTKKEIEDIETFLSLFEEEFNIYDKLYKIVTNNENNNYLIRYKMSAKQISYYNLLVEINNVLNQNNLKNFLFNLKIENNKLSDEIKTGLIQLNALLNNFKNTIAKYDWDNYTYMSPAYLYNLLFNDTFGSLSLYALQFKKKFEKYETEEHFSPNGKIHYTLIKKSKSIPNKIENDNNNDIKTDNNIIIDHTKNENENDGVLLIFCLPNGGCYELLPKSKIEFYLNNGFSFLCWNYRGYGFSKGRANFSNVKTDALEIYDLIVNNTKYHFTKIAVMGHSIGGVAACYLAKNRHVDLLISDRNFCDIKRLTNNFYCGQLLSTLISFLFIGKTDNIYNFITYTNNKNDLKNENKNVINKIIIYSPSDMLILNDSTVKSGVSRYIIKNYIIYKNENNQVIKNKENFLDIVFNKNDKTRFITNFISLIHSYYEKMNNFYNGDFKSLKKKADNNNDINEKNRISEEEEKFNETQTLFKFFDKFMGICCDNLNFLTTYRTSLRRETIFIDNFFNNLLIWGAQGEEDDYCDFYSYKGKIVLQEAYEILSNNNLNKEIINPLKNLINSVVEDLKKIIYVMDNLDIVNQANENDKKINENEIKNDVNDINISIDINNNNKNLKEKLISDKSEIDSDIIIDTKIKPDNSLIHKSKNFYDKLNDIKGDIKLFKTITGHSGLLRVDEREQFYTILLCSGIIS
jgi:hypothetical protein